MRTSLLAVTLAGAFASSAQAQAQSNLTIRGGEERAAGLKALIHLEIRYEPDTGMQASFGTLRIGRGTTSYMESVIAFEPFHGESTRAWVLGANYTVASGTLLLGYGRKTPEGVSRTERLSIGYEHALSRRTYLYADASQRKIAATVKHFDIGIRASF